MSEKEQIEKRGTEAQVGFGVENIRLSEDEKAVVILDQSRLPNETVYLRLEEAEDFYAESTGCTGNRYFCSLCNFCTFPPHAGVWK